MLTPEQARERTAALMADGRWRTAQDVATRIGGNPHQAGIALMALVRENRAIREVIHRHRDKIATYRMPVQEAAE
jgi:hypothetical protein